MGYRDALIGGLLVTSALRRRDTRGCLVEVWCRYPIDEEPTGAAHVTHRYTATVDRLGMDARVYL